MPRNLNSLFAEETAKSAQSQLFHLIEIQYPYIDTDDQGGVLFLVDSNYDVHLGGQEYVRFPVKFNGASMNSDGSIDQASLSVANVSREIMYYVEKCDGLRNMRVKVKMVYANALDYLYTPNPDGTVTTAANPLANANAYIEDEYLIDNYSANETVVTFQLFPIIDLEIKLPRRRYMTDSCYWIYGDPTTCQYDLNVGNALPSCNKTLKDCKAHRRIIVLPCSLTVTNNSANAVLTGITTFTTPDDISGGELTVGGTNYEISHYNRAELVLTLVLKAPYTGTTQTTWDYVLKTRKGNERNFGAFPGVSGSRRIFL